MGGKMDSMVKKGSLDVGCGKYSFELEGPEPKDNSAPKDGKNKQCVPSMIFPMGFERKEALETIIPQFCSQRDVEDKMFDKDSKYPSLSYRSQVYPDMTVNLAITRNKECSDRSSTFVTKDRCKHLLGGVAVDACSVNQDEDKMGGTVDDGCLTYSIKASQNKLDYAKGTCHVDITQYFDGKNYKLDAVIKDAKNGLLAQCKNEKLQIDRVVLCQTGNHSVLPKMVQMVQRDDGRLWVSYQGAGFISDDKVCKGGKDKYKDGKRSMSCTITC
jgi:hypothetical protein